MNGIEGKKVQVLLVDLSSAPTIRTAGGTDSISVKGVHSRLFSREERCSGICGVGDEGVEPVSFMSTLE